MYLALRTVKFQLVKVAKWTAKLNEKCENEKDLRLSRIRMTDKDVESVKAILTQHYFPNAGILLFCMMHAFFTLDRNLGCVLCCALNWNPG
jgi:hypothetical protein